jgi:ferredoxin-NADP reductase
MLRHARDVGQESLLRIAVSARTRADLPYADELEAAGALIVLTREDTAGRAGGRLAAAELSPLVTAGATCYICGSNSFAEAASALLVAEGVPTPSIRVERFGPSG